MKSWVKLTAIFAGLAVVGWAAWDYLHPAPESNPIVAHGEHSVTVLPFSSLQNSLNNLPLGWVEHKFWMIRAMSLSYGEKAGKQALKCETNGTASILSRTTNIEVGDYPILVWDWRVDVPISSPVDEATKAGDDHPARLLLQMVDREGGKHPFEIIWSNRKFKPGDYLRIGGFTHYVANGLNENTGVWQHQEVNLMQIYRDIFKRDDYPILKSIGIFCDSDNTGARSVAYFTDVSMRAK